MIGSDQCPRCESKRVASIKMQDSGDTISGCIACKTLWEPFDIAELIDDQDPYSSFQTMCENCAFRPDSPEREDPKQWQNLIEMLAYLETPFMCHKGVPLAAPESDDSHDHPKRPDGRPDLSRSRYCRGWMLYARAGKLHTLLPKREAVS